MPPWLFGNQNPKSKRIPLPLTIPVNFNSPWSAKYLVSNSTHTAFHFVPTGRIKFQTGEKRYQVVRILLLVSAI